MPTTARANAPSFWRALRRYAWIPVVTAVVAAVAVYVLTSRETKQYKASSLISVTVQDFDTAAAGVQGGPQDPDVIAATNVALVAQRDTAVRAARRLGDQTANQVQNAVKVSRQGQSELIRVTATSTSPSAAARIANAYAQAFVVGEATRQKGQYRAARRSLQRQYDALPPNRQKLAQGQALADELTRIGLLSSLPGSSARVVSQAVSPTSSTNSSPVRNTAVAALIGLLVGLGLVALRDQSDKSLRSVDDLEEAFDSPVLVSIPRDRGLRRYASIHDLSDDAQEAYRLLDAQLDHVLDESDGRSVVVTSAGPAEGKTTTAWHLASAAASRGERVLLIEADPDHDALDRHMNGRGVEVTEATVSGNGRGVQRVSLTDGSSFDVLPVATASGANGRRPSHRVLATIVEQYESSYFVVVDAAPVSRVADGFALAKAAAGVLVVSAPGAVTRAAAERFAGQMRRNGISVVGLVANGYGATDELQYS